MFFNVAQHQLSISCCMQLTRLSKKSQEEGSNVIKEVAFNSNYKSLESRKELGGGTKMFHLSDSKVLKGRKIGVKNTATKGEVNTGAKISSVENFGPKEKEKLNSVMSKNKGLSSKFSMVGYVPFSSDYHAPRRHPPKNN